MYIEKTTKAGKTIEVERYYTYRAYKPGERRSPKKEISPEKMQEANERHAIKYLRQLMNCNFDDHSLYLTMEYFKEPVRDYVSPEQMKADMKSFLAKARRFYRKHGAELKYIWVAAVGKRSARHFHMVMSGIPEMDYRAIRDELQQIWDSIYMARHSKRSYIHLEYLYGDNYGRLAAYFIKQSKTTWETIGKKIGKRWNSSRNLKKPVVTKKIIGHKAFRKEPKAPKGYYIDTEYTRSGIGDADYGGYEYLSYILIKSGDAVCNQD